MQAPSDNINIPLLLLSAEFVVKLEEECVSFWFYVHIEPNTAVNHSRDG